jgi:hypothetical protein
VRRLALIAAVLVAGLLSTAPAASAARAGAHTIFYINQTPVKILMAASPGSTTGRTGWTVPAGAGGSFEVSQGWNGRVWGRTGCHFDAGGEGHCATGDCDGRFECRGWGDIPATLAEYNLDSFAGLDFYDVSMVDGSNLPMYIYPTSGQAAKKVSIHGCVRAGCTKAVRCPKVLKIFAHAKYVACESACAKLGGDQNCCRGKWAPRSQCNPRKWPVDYAAVFKRAEPYAYSYVDDDATSVYVCKGRCDYRIVFGLSPPKRRPS